MGFINHGHRRDQRLDHTAEEDFGGWVVLIVFGQTSVENARVDEYHSSTSCLFRSEYLSRATPRPVPRTVGMARNSRMAFRWRSMSASVNTIGLASSSTSSARSPVANVAVASRT